MPVCMLGETGVELVFQKLGLPSEAEPPTNNCRTKLPTKAAKPGPLDDPGSLAGGLKIVCKHSAVKILQTDFMVLPET